MTTASVTVEFDKLYLLDLSDSGRLEDLGDNEVIALGDCAVLHSFSLWASYGLGR